MKFWKKSSRWRKARRAAFAESNWRHVAMLDCLAYGFNPLRPSIQRMLYAESARMSRRIIEHYRAWSGFILPKLA